MKLPYFKQWQSKCRERALFTVMLAGTLLALIVILGIAVDLAQLQNAKLRVQKAVDSSSIAATSILQSQSADAIRSTAQQILNDNLNSVGIPSSDIRSVSITLLPNELAPRTVQVSAALISRYRIFNLIPGFGSNSVVSAAAQAGDKRVATVLVLDISNSMADPVGNCATLPSHPRSCTKLDFLKTAATDFVTAFNPQDRLAVVTFSDSAQVLYPMTQNPNKSAINFSINALVAAGRTNTYAAMVLARTEITSSSTSDLGIGDIRAIVLVTDGAPLADEATASVPPVPSGCLTTVNSTTDIIMNQRKKRYVAALVQSDLARSASATVYAIGLGPQGIPTPGDHCPSTSDTGTYFSFPPTDAFQCANHDDIVKNYFLGRLTNDQTSMAGNPAVLPQVADPDFPCVPGRSAIAHIKEGKFYPTNNVDDLSPLLAAIGKHISAVLKE